MKIKAPKNNKHIYLKLTALCISAAVILGGCTGASPQAQQIKENVHISQTAKQEETDTLILDFQYPVIEGARNEEELNLAIKKDLDAAIKEVQEIADEAAANPEAWNLDTKLSLCTRETSYIDEKNDLVSIVMEYSNYTGGPHGMNWNKAYTFFRKDGKLCKVQDLFKDPESGMNQLRQAVADKIAENPEAYYPSAMEYVNGLETFDFYTYENTLVLWFNPYDLAPYPAGLITIEIPFNELEDFKLK